MKNAWHYDFPIGTVLLAEENGALTRLDFMDRDLCPAGYTMAETPLLRRAAVQLKEYFAGNRKTFDLPLSLQGTPFQMKVWQALQTIPAGTTCSYKDIAVQIGQPRACRAVGGANNRNPIAIIVPCHRVVGHNGHLTGYGGGLAIKEYLLELEKRYA